ncbi:hypothetical protein IIZ81_03570 [Candidatus Saccharibacteria bacterium]|nr:hypothetical protein [Candidatus Saccharibacteria bacterium]
MKYTNAKYIAAAVATSGIALASMAGTCFADTTNPASVPIFLESMATPIDFTVGVVENDDAKMHISHKGTADTNEATVTSLKITNNLHSAAIAVSEISVQKLSNGEYDLVSYGTDFTGFKINSKKYALAINEKNNTQVSPVQDLFGGYRPDNDTIAANGGTVQYGFAGKVTLSSTSVSSVQISNLVVTISQ